MNSASASGKIRITHNSTSALLEDGWAASVAVPHSIAGRRKPRHQANIGAVVSLMLTAIALAVHGYHPYVEDGGVYLTGVKHLLNPALYPHWSGFATAHLHYEMFAPVVAALVRATGVGLMSLMLLLYLAGIWSTLFAGWLIASRCTTSLQGRLGAVSVLALSLTVPVAGTSLMLMDPYVTARSISTPCALLAMVGALDLVAAMRRGAPFSLNSIALCCGSLLLAATVHPLMAGYALACVLLLMPNAVHEVRIRRIVIGAVCLAGFAAAACIDSYSPPVSAAYLRVAETRGYWFLSTWHWYEQFGLLAPIVLLIVLAVVMKSPALQELATMSSAAGVTTIASAMCFARMALAGHLVARMQPLRVFQFIYVLMLLALGAYLGERILQRRPVRWLALFAALGSLLYFVQTQTFPDSPHMELPGRAPQNAWEQGFEWIREHTPVGAAFAMDANYITAAGEDSQNFRAIAERSAMPEYSKDGGIASIAPGLTAAWSQGVLLQKALNRGVDAARIHTLRDAGVDWVVLAGNTPIPVPCEYSNSRMKVCRISR